MGLFSKTKKRSIEEIEKSIRDSEMREEALRRETISLGKPEASSSWGSKREPKSLGQLLYGDFKISDDPIKDFKREVEIIKMAGGDPEDLIPKYIRRLKADRYSEEEGEERLRRILKKMEEKEDW